MGREVLWVNLGRRRGLDRGSRPMEGRALPGAHGENRGDGYWSAGFDGVTAVVVAGVVDKGRAEGDGSGAAVSCHARSVR